jgi:hypothetical protein
MLVFHTINKHTSIQHKYGHISPSISLLIARTIITQSKRFFISNPLHSSLHFHLVEMEPLNIAVVGLG